METGLSGDVGGVSTGFSQSWWRLAAFLALALRIRCPSLGSPRVSFLGAGIASITRS